MIHQTRRTLKLIECSRNTYRWAHCCSHPISRLRSFVPLRQVSVWDCVPLGWSKICLDHLASKKPVNPWPELIHRFLWCKMIQTDLGSLIQIRITPKERSLKPKPGVMVRDFPVKTERSRFCGPLIGPWALRENDALQLANFERKLYWLETHWSHIVKSNKWLLVADNNVSCH